MDFFRGEQIPVPSQDGNGEQGSQEGRHSEQGCLAEVVQQAAEGRCAQPG